MQQAIQQATDAVLAGRRPTAETDRVLSRESTSVANPADRAAVPPPPPPPAPAAASPLVGNPSTETDQNTQGATPSSTAQKARSLKERAVAMGTIGSLGASPSPLPQDSPKPGSTGKLSLKDRAKRLGLSKPSHHHPSKEEQLPDLSPPDTWPSLDALKAKFEGKGTLWDSAVTTNAQTRKTTISKELYGSEDKLTEVPVRAEGVDGAPMPLKVHTSGRVGIPRKQGTRWSEIKHVAFVKHGEDGPITFHPVKEALRCE